MSLCCLIDYLLIAGAAIALLVILIVYFTTETYPKIPYFKSEQTYINPKTDEREPFPSLDDPSSVDLSVVIPAYNEEDRLPVMLDECIDFLESRAKDSSFTYEIIIVDDGSRDKTSKVGIDYAGTLGADKLRVLTLEKNRGKGGAVRMGMLRARGIHLLFADADGATKFSDLDKLSEALVKQQSGIVCGSRAHLEKDSIAARSLFRTILMIGFHWCVWLFGAKSIKDTQCGFKLMTRETARVCFQSLHIERWAFDVELLKIAEMKNIPIAEVAVNWKEIEGSKLNPVLASIQMFKDLFFLWLRYQIGAWKLVEKRD